MGAFRGLLFGDSHTSSDFVRIAVWIVVLFVLTVFVFIVTNLRAVEAFGRPLGTYALWGIMGLAGLTAIANAYFGGGLLASLANTFSPLLGAILVALANIIMTGDNGEGGPIFSVLLLLVGILVALLAGIVTYGIGVGLRYLISQFTGFPRVA